MNGSMHPPQLDGFVHLFNAEAFFEAHEVLEDYWRRPDCQERALYQGIIQIAAACVHLKNGTPEGAGELLKKARQNLTPYLTIYRELDLPKILEETERRLREPFAPFPKISYCNL